MDSLEEQKEWVWDRMSQLVMEATSSADPKGIVDSFDVTDRIIFDIRGFVANVENGGLFEYLCGAVSWNIEATIHTLYRIGENKIATVLEEIFNEFPTEYESLSRDEKEVVTQRVMDAFFDDKRLKEFENAVYELSIEKICEHLNRLGLDK